MEEVPSGSHPAWTQLRAGGSVIQPAFLAARMFIVRCQIRLVQAKQDPAELSRCALQLRDLYAANADSASAWCDMAALFRMAPSEPRQEGASSRAKVPAAQEQRPRRHQINAQDGGA